ncbi:MAG: hypothetical protein DI535_14620 [Citrobacter freundii]|nr:MAG: hypothetical protein DI535_14620 [Citrobacter freundii]
MEGIHEFVEGSFVAVLAVSRKTVQAAGPGEECDFGSDEMDIGRICFCFDGPGSRCFIFFYLIGDCLKCFSEIFFESALLKSMKISL